METNLSQTLYGLYGSQVKRKNAIGYCYFHKCHLTISTLKGHQCLSKQCPYLKKHEDNAYWEEREKIKLIKKEKKNGANLCM